MLDMIPTTLWAPLLTGVGVVAGAGITQIGNALRGRKTDHLAAGDGVRDDARYLAERLNEERAEKERLYGRNQELHAQINRLLHVNDDVMTRASNAVSEVTNALAVDGRATNAPPTP